MRNKIIFLFLGLLIITSISGLRYDVIENFESGEINLTSFPNEDSEPDSWALDSLVTHQNSHYSLKLFGNTWKVLEIEPLSLSSDTVWQVACFVENRGQYQGFGLMDEENVLLYSFAGTQLLDVETWLHVYQGLFPTNQWNLFQLPVGDDWLAWFEYEPEITAIVFINSNPGTTYFDDIWDISSILPHPPVVSIDSNQRRAFQDNQNRRWTEVQFFAHVIDEYCDEHQFYWEFGDGEISLEQNPVHLFETTANHLFTVFLAVENCFQQWGFATNQVQLEQGVSSLPLTMNFVGDVMLARRYEEPGGIIPTQGVEAIFEPTLPILGDAADITIVNLESPLTTSNDRHPTKTIVFKGNPANVEGLVHAKVDIAMLANNHILDFMQSGLVETQQVLEVAGILHHGAGTNSYEAYMPTFKTIKGINTAFLASSDRTGHYNNFQPYLQAGFNRPGFAYMTPYFVKKQIESVREISDLVIVCLHSGSEYSLGPISDYDYFCFDYEDSDENPDYRWDIPKMHDRDFRQFLIEQGADLVINHHPHIIQGVEVYNGKVIAHSLGNFVFDLDYPETMPSMILTAEADETGFNAYSIIPVYIDRYIPQPATGKLGLHILDYLANRSKELDTFLQVDRDNVLANVILDETVMEITESETEAALLFQLADGDYLSTPQVLAKNGFLAKIQDILPSGEYQFRLGRELIWFGNFEDEGCSLWDTESSNYVYYDETVFLEGERSLKHERPVGSGNLTSNLRHRIKKYYNVSYTLYGSIKTFNIDNANIEIRYFSTRTSPSPISSELLTAEYSGTNQWTFLFRELNVPNNAGYFDIRLRSSAPLLGNGAAWFDDVGLIKWTDWQDWNGNIEIENPNDFYFLQVKSSTEVTYATITYTEKGYQTGSSNQSFEDVVYPASVSSRLHPNYPNPFNSQTHFSFTAYQSGTVKLEIFNLKGQKVKSLLNHVVNAGLHTIIWQGKNNNGTEVASGIYFYQLSFDGIAVDTKKCLLLK